PAWYLIESGWAYRLTGRYDDSITALKGLISRNPDFMSAYVHLAISYLTQWAAQLSPDRQTLEQAFVVTQKALALNDSSPSTHKVLGFIYLLQKQHEQAIAEMERAIALEPNDGDSYTALAHVLSYAGRPEEALQSVERATHLGPAPGSEGYFYNLGSVY